MTTNVPGTRQPMLQVRDSLLRGAGLGLFTMEQLHENQVVCEYVGRTMQTRDALRLEEKSYLMRLGPQVYVDARNELDSFARYINDCRNPKGHNVRFVKLPDEGKALVIATRQIHPGEELYASYGRWYWLSCSTATQLSDAEVDELRRGYLKHSIA